MDKPRSLKLNFIMNTVLTMSSVIFPLITFPYVSRILLPVGTGKVSFATSLVYYFSMFSQLGIPTYGIRACAVVRDDREKLTRTVHELLVINLVMSAAAYAVFFALLGFVPRLREERVLYLIVSTTIFFNAIGMEWLYKGLEQYTYITVRSLTFKLIALGAMFLLVRERGDYVVYGAISIFAASASNVFNFIHAHKYISMKPIGRYHFRHHLKAVLIFFAMSCATTIYTHLDTVMLGFMKTDEDVGIYNAAVKIKTVLVSVVTSLGHVLLPRASYYVQHGLMDEFRRVSRKALNFVFLLSVPLMTYFMLFAKQGVFFLSGTAYAAAVLPMQIIMPTLLFIGITNILGIQVLVPLGREKVVLYSEIAGAVTDLVLNALLIPTLASAGAAIGTLAAEFVVLLIQWAALRRDMSDAFHAVPYVKIMASLLLAVCASVWTPLAVTDNFWTLAVSSVLFFGVYGGVLLLVKEPLTREIAGQTVGKVKDLLRR